MELTKNEAAVIEAVEQTAELKVLEDLQLALVGGGMGDTVL